MRIPFATNSYKSTSLPLSAQRLVNWYAEIEPGDAKSPVALFNTPGTVLFATCGTGKIRGACYHNGKAYFVAGESLYEVDSAGSSYLLGVVSNDTRCSMASNGTQLVIVNGSTGYIYNSSTGVFGPITDPDFPEAETVDFLDGYFIFTKPDSGQFFISAISDGTNYDALDFATAESSPDDTIRVLVDHRELWLFGERSVEVWYNSGATDFPFERVSDTILERGCAAKFTPAKEDNTVFWLGDDRIVYKAAGYTPQRVSTFAIEQAFSGYSTVSDAFAYTYSQNGHKFYVMTFPTENATWVYDISTELWHERETGIGNRHLANAHCVCFDKHLVGDYRNGRVYYFDTDVFTDNATDIRRMAISPVIHADRKRLYMRNMELDCETATGNASAEVEIALTWSDDGGRTFSVTAPIRGLGKSYETIKRIVWRRLGCFRQRIFRIVTTSAFRSVVIAAHAEVEQGAE